MKRESRPLKNQMTYLTLVGLNLLIAFDFFKLHMNVKWLQIEYLFMSSCLRHTHKGMRVNRSQKSRRGVHGS